MSGNANIIVIEGRLTRDPNFTKTKNGKSLCKFSMANNRYYYTNGSLQKEVYFFDFITWGYNAEKAASSLSKGSHVLVSGELRQNSYFTKEGNRRNRHSKGTIPEYGRRWHHSLLLFLSPGR